MRKVLLLAMVFCFVLAGTSFAFHDAGVADCAGCHTMHNSEDGALVDPDSPNGNPWLLIDATPSDVCLSCHSTGSRGVFSNDPLAPLAVKGAGDFVFLLEDNINDGHGGGDTLADGSWANAVPGTKGGHSIIAPSKGAVADPYLTVGPGGTFPASQLGCSSCHDPHGNTNFRLLYGAGSIQDGLFTFTNAAPNAVGINLRGTPEANDNHTAYISGMSAWCGNCHGDFHNNNTKLIHPSGSTIGGTIASNYNLYNGTDDITGGNAATAYLAAVPFEDAANTIASTAGPTAASQVMCLTCHRAHATSAENMGRWDFGVTLLFEDGDESGSYEIPDPYSSINQRSLCNKCHVKDVNDHLE